MQKVEISQTGSLAVIWQDNWNLHSAVTLMSYEYNVHKEKTIAVEAKRRHMS